MTDKRDLTPAEDSVPLRLVVFLMTMTCICASCIFVRTAWPVFVLSVSLASIGSVVSYQYRNEKQNWMQWIVIVGVFAVGANAAAEFMDPNNGTIDFWGPMVHFVAGTFALHTFDLKSRSDINLSALLGALILCLLSPVVRGMYFGLAVFNYICLGTVMLYFDCMSRTLHNWLDKPMELAPVVEVANVTGRRKPRGSVYLTVALLPLFSAICFLLVPRSDNLIDTIMSNLKHLDLAAIMRMMPGNQPAINMDMPRHEFKPFGDRKVDMKRKKHELENKDEVDKKLREMGVETRKIVKVKEEKKEEKKEKPKEDEKKQEKKGKPAGQAKKSPPKQAPGERIKNNRPKDNKLGGDSLDLDTDPPDSTVLVYKVNATRLFFSRRTVFDSFDGRKWTRSKDKIKTTNIDVKDPNAVVLDKDKDANAPNPAPPDTDTAGTDTAAASGTDEKELTPEEEAEKELQQEKLAELSKRDTGFGPDMSVDYVFGVPAKGSFPINQASALRLPSKLPCISLTQTFEVATDADAVFPSAWLPQSLTYKGKKIIVDDYGQIKNPDNIKKGTRFSVNSQFPVYNLPAMRTEPVITEEREKEIRDQLSNYLEIPENTSDEVLAMAEAFAGKTGNWFAVADRICTQLRAACTLEIDKPVDYQPAEDRVKDFLITRKAGNPKDFSTAFVILCRSVGLPARIVYGFSPGTFNKDTGSQDIRMTDAMTWAEVYIPDYGWVPFDATPGGVLPGVKRDEGFSFWTVLKWLCDKLGIPLDEDWTPKKIMTLISIVVSLAFLLAGLIIAIVFFIRWRRRRSKHPWQDDAWRVWNELAKDFKKARMERLPTETPHQFVERIKRIVQEQRREGVMASYDLPQALEQFFITYEAVHFGNKQGLPTLKGQAQELRKMIKANKVSEKGKPSGGPGGGMERGGDRAAGAVRGRR
ncbi:MAG: transglutaminase family protein [Cyanobacteria bacterium SZAS LIN-3]|nr:transglutaminase family protein [Cyanobacteria bacterium SZAS LIN-3]